MVYKLDSLISLTSGGTPSKSNPSYWSGNIPWVSAKVMYVDYISTSDLFITQDGLNHGSRLAPVGSILLLTRGSGLFNDIPICKVTSEVAYNQDVKCIMSKDENLLTNDYLFYWLKGHKKDIAGILETTSIGAGKIDTSRFLGLDIDLPTLEDQAKAVSCASAIFRKIELNNQINKQLEEMAQAIFKSWFIDFEPFKDGEFVDSELGRIPKGWRVGTIQEIASRIGSGGTPKSNKEEYYKGDIPWFGTGEFNDSFIIDSLKHITKEAIDCSSAKVYPSHTVLIAMYGATVGKLSILSSEATFNQAALGIVAKDYLPYPFIFLTLLYNREPLIRLACGAAQQNLNAGIIKTFPIIIPTDEILTKFGEVSIPIFSKIESLQKQNTHLSSLRDTLLPKLMSGEINLEQYGNQ